MIIQHTESNVVASHNLGPTQLFQIRTNAHAFKMLSSGLYSDKIAAVLREIGCNAHDAHISVGKSHVPIEVKLPNNIDNQFYIKDQGPGLSHEDVMGLYTTYFASTKQSSNDFTGAFGLGSKSPFSYTDSFTITSCHGGKCRIYSAHIGAEGSPAVAKMSEFDTKETGITIGFHVKPADFYMFKDRAASIFRFFTPFPTILGGEAIKPLQFGVNHADWGFLKEGLGSYPIAQMGNVHYPIQPDKLGATAYGNLVTGIKYVRNMLIRFPLGYLEVAASREELSYTPKTIETLVAKLEEVGRAIALDLEAQWLKSLTGGWASKCEFNELRHAITRGMSINPNLLREAGVKDPGGLYLACRTNMAVIGQRNDLDKIHVRWYENTSRGIKSKQPSVTQRIYIPLEKDLCIITGEETHAQSRVRKAIAEGTLKTAILIHPRKKQGGTFVDVDKATKQLLAELGTMPVKDLSMFDAPVRAKRTKKGTLPTIPTEWKDFTTYLQVKKGRRRSTIYQLIPDVKHLERWEQQDFDNTISALSTFLGIEQPLYIMAGEIRRYRLDKQPNWKPYHIYLKEQLESPKVLKELQDRIKTFRSKIDLTLHADDSVLAKLVNLKHHYITIYDQIKPILKKKKVLDIIEDVYTASIDIAISTIPTVLVQYKKALKYIDSTIQAPELKLEEESLEAVFPKVGAISWNVIYELATVSPKILLTLLEEILT